MANHSPETVTRYRVPRSVVQASANALRTMSAGRIESVVLWQGTVSTQEMAVVRELVVPLQVAGPLHFNVPLEERFRLIDAVSSSGELILVQLHTHPREAFHSDVDDRLAIPQHVGGISIVVPNFARDWDGNLASTSVNRHMGGARWQELGAKVVETLFEIS